MSCAIKGCISRSRQKENHNEIITFHRFPKDEEIKNAWISCVMRNKTDWTLRTYSRICSKHFTQDSFINTQNTKWRRLKENAVPTLYLADTLASDPVPMDVCGAEYIGGSSDILEESDINIDVPEKLAIVPTPGDVMVVTSKKKLTAESATHIRRQKKMVSCNQHERIISRLQEELEKVKKISQRRLRKINTLTKRLSRISKKTGDLYSILIDRLKQENVETEYLTMLENINKNDIIRRFLQKQGGEALAREFSQDIKKFAVTLHYLSPKAYTFIREQFQDVLPHPKTITAWYKGVDCSPGFTSESFDAIKIRVQQNPDKPLFCALAIDEMAIRKLIEWDSHNQNYYGFVNLGCELDSDSVPVATQSLTFMVTCLNDTWKIPVGYFLIQFVKSEQKATLVRQCIQLLQECGICIVALTFDGAASNIAMSSYLGCDVSTGSVSFQCGESETEICLWPDPCHNIKLVRNALADKNTLVDSDNNIISWNHIENLVKLQEGEGLHLGNRLTRGHINYVKQKMKVRLATQLFSNSVADALQYCREKGIPGFEDCEGTITFIRIFNNLFDIFNSRNLQAKGWKRALAPFNVEETKVFFEAADTYIRNLKMLDGTYLINSNRKTGLNGFLVCMKSLMKIYESTVLNKKIQYLCTYKMSQDQIELFFGAIRAKCGFNNNPSARTFQAAYKRLLVHAQFKDGSSGNCIPLENIKILNYKPKNPIEAINQSSGNICLLRDTEISGTNSETASLSLSYIDFDHDYVATTTSLSEYSTDVVHYMAGFVVRKLQKSLKCETCIESLCVNENDSERVTLISIKDRGGLITPSKDVFKICEVTERIVRQEKRKVSGEFLGRRKHIMTIITKVCSTFIESRIFNNLAVHSLEHTFDDNHRILLIKAICKTYLTARIHYMIKQACVPQDKIRNFLTKTILFKGQ